MAVELSYSKGSVLEAAKGLDMDASRLSSDKPLYKGIVIGLETMCQIKAIAYKDNLVFATLDHVAHSLTAFDYCHYLIILTKQQVLLEKIMLLPVNASDTAVQGNDFSTIFGILIHGMITNFVFVK